ncbi:hypothetical protein TSMEX_000809, partial [Taenia solium]
MGGKRDSSMAANRIDRPLYEVYKEEKGLLKQSLKHLGMQIWNTMSFPQRTNFLIVMAGVMYFCMICVNSHTLDSSWGDTDSFDMETGENELLVKDLVTKVGNLSPDQRRAVMKFIKTVDLVLRKEGFDSNIPGR